MTLFKVPFKVIVLSYVHMLTYNAVLYIFDIDLHLKRRLTIIRGFKVPLKSNKIERNKS